MELKKGYKQTDLGVIPDDWEIKEFADVMDGFSSGQTPYRAVVEYYKGDIPWITSGELNYNIITDTIEKITIEGAREANLKKIPKGTFLFAITGLEAAGTRGSCAITGIEATTNQSCMALYPKKGLLTTPYLYHYYVRYGNELAFKYCQGTKQQSYTGGIAKKLPIIVPPSLSEQTAIANALSDMDALISQTEKLIEKKKAIKQGAMQELLKPKEGWVTKKLGDVAKFFKGSGLPKADLTEDGRYRCIHYGELFTFYKENIDNIKSRTNKNFGAFLSSMNDVLMPTSDVTPNGLATASCIDENNIVLGGDILVIRSDSNIIDGVFLSYSIKFNRQQIMKLVSGSTVYHLYGSDMSKYIFSFPEIKIQQEISRLLIDMEDEINKYQTKLTKLKQQKQGMMQALLTGKIRLI